MEKGKRRRGERRKKMRDREGNRVVKREIEVREDDDEERGERRKKKKRREEKGELKRRRRGGIKGEIGEEEVRNIRRGKEKEGQKESKRKKGEGDRKR